MTVDYKNHNIEKMCTVASHAEKRYGYEMALKIQLRIDQISAATDVEELIQYKVGRCHALKGNRKGQYAMDLVHPMRLVFERQGETVQIAVIQEIVDYH